MASRSPLPSGHVPGLDGIRAFAICLVLLSHSVIFGQFSSLRLVGLGGGYVGVAVFFVMSGYLITTLLLKEEDRTGGISLRAFYLRRALRLFPALWLYLLVVGAFCLAGQLPNHPWHSFVASLLYVRNFIGRGNETDHLWSLSIEEQFYLLWPVILVYLARRNSTRLGVALSGIAAVTAWRLLAANAGLASAGALYIRSDFRFDAPLFGCALALAIKVAPQLVNWSNSTPLRSSLLAAAGATGLIVWVVFRLGEKVYPGSGDTFVYLLSLMLLLSQVGVRRSPGWFAWGPLVKLGQISYGVYLWQQFFLGPRVAPFYTVRTFPIGLLATLAVAATSYWLLERPLLRLKDRIQLNHDRLSEGQNTNAASQ